MSLKIIFLIFLLTVSSAKASKCVAHRGYHGAYVENTIRSIYEAYKQKISGIEFDIRHTKDGVAYLLHDSDLKRVAKNRSQSKRCNTKTNINSLTSQHIEENCIHNDGQKIGQFSNAVQMFSTWTNYQFPIANLFIELKDNPSQNSMELIGKLIQIYPVDKIYVISFQRNYLMKLKNELGNSGVKYIFLISKLSNVSNFDLDGFGYKKTSYNEKELIKYLKSHGIISYLWTKNSQKELEYYHKLGVDFIATDNPDICSKIENRQ